MFRFVLFVAALLTSSVAAFAQSGQAWDIYGGVAVQHYTPEYAQSAVYKYGWDFSITQRAYASHPWIGGQIESSGVYGSTPATFPGLGTIPGSTPSGTLKSALYTAMAGPIVYLPLHRLRPFAHVLVGGVVTDDTTGGTGVIPVQTTNGYFGTQGGAGIDARITRHTWARVQGDWLRIWQIDNSHTDTVRLTAGVVYSF